MKAPSFKELFSLKGKNAIVTGGVGILGARCCAGLGEFGANVAVVDIDEDAALKYAIDLSETYNINAIGIGCDVSSPSSVASMVQQVGNAFGEIHILHNNAQGKSADVPFEEYSLEEWRVTAMVNEEGYFLVAQAVGQKMVSQDKGGSIVQTSSIYGIIAPDHRIYQDSTYKGRQIGSSAVYAFSKAGVLGLTRYLAAYWADKGIRVNTLTPGGVESGQNETFKQKYGARVPMGRMANRDEIVGALIFLASDASSYVTGQNLIVDGGMSAW